MKNSREYKIHPLDLNTNKAIGLALPMTDATGRFISNYTTLKQAKSNLKNLLFTNLGERIMYPNFGCDLYRYVFEQNIDSTFIYLKNHIMNQVNIWIPYIQISKLDINLNPNTNDVSFDIIFNLNDDIFSSERIQFELNQ